MRRRGGFTLIELVMVLAIMGVLAALAAPRYANALNRYRAGVAAARVAADLALAQSRARSTSASRSVVFQISASTYQLPSEPGRSPGSTYQVDLARSPYNVSIGTVNFNGNASVSFNGFGVPGCAGYVTVQAGTTLRTISIDAATGATSIQ